MPGLNVPVVGFSPLLPDSRSWFLSLLALLQALRQQNVSASAVLLNIDLARAAFLRRITGRSCLVLERELLSEEQFANGLYQATFGSDLVVVASEEPMLNSFSERFPSEHRLSKLAKEYDFAMLVSAEMEMLGPTAISSFLGLPKLFPELKILPPVVTFNQAEVDEEQQLNFSDRFHQVFGLAPTAIGLVPERLFEAECPAKGVQEERSLLAQSRDFYIDLLAVFSESLKGNHLVKSAARCKTELPFEFDGARTRRARIAVSDDPCFQLLFQNNLEILKQAGAEIVPFSPMADSRLPRDIGGIYLSSGYLADYAISLEGNTDIAEAIVEFVKEGGVLLSEGAGTACLCRNCEFDLESGEERDNLRGLGLIDAEVKYSSTKGLEFCEIEILEESILGPSETEIAAASTGSWMLKAQPTTQKIARLKLSDAPGQFEGFSPSAQSFCTFQLLNFSSSPEVALSIVDAAEVFQRSKQRELMPELPDDEPETF